MGRQRSELGPIKLTYIMANSTFYITPICHFATLTFDHKGCEKGFDERFEPERWKHTRQKLQPKSIPVSGLKEYLVPAKPHLRRCVQRSLEALKWPHTVHRSATRTHHPLTVPLETSSTKYVVKVFCDLSFNPIDGLIKHLILFVICTFGVMR